MGVGTLRWRLFVLLAYSPTLTRFYFSFYIQLGIYFELSNPKDSIVATFGANKVNDVKYGAIIASVTIFVAVLVRALMNYRKKHGGGEADSEENAYLRHEEHSTRR